MSKNAQRPAPAAPTSMEAPPLDPAEVVARFQLETDALIARIQQDHQRQMVEMERKVASLQDEWGTTRAEVTGLKRAIEDALHRMQSGIAEAINAQKESVSAARRASESAAVFDKLKASQPDFHRTVAEQNRTIAGVRDAMAHLEERIGGFGKRLDELDVVAEDYEETKGAVRGIDHIVKDLNASERQRRQVNGRGA